MVERRVPKPPPGGYGTGLCPEWIGRRHCDDRAACHDHGCQGPGLPEQAHAKVQAFLWARFAMPARLRSLQFESTSFDLPHGTWLPCAAKDQALARGGYIVDGVRVPLCKHHRSLEGLEAVLAARGR